MLERGASRRDSVARERPLDAAQPRRVAHDRSRTRLWRAAVERPGTGLLWTETDRPSRNLVGTPRKLVTSRAGPRGEHGYGESQLALPSFRAARRGADVLQLTGLEQVSTT